MQECRAPIGAAAAVDADEAEGADTRALAQPAHRAAGSFLAGAAWGVFAISIWAGWFVLTRLDTATHLSAYDLVALRFGVSAIVLIPIAIRMRFGLGYVSWRNALALFAGSGVVYSLSTTVGVTYAPAAEGAALTPGVMPMATALLSVLLLKERLTRSQIAGFSFILAGVIAIGGLGLFQSAHREWIGHILFLTGAFLFAGYTIALRRSGLTGLEATALVSLWSSVVYLPIYLFALHPRLLDVPPASLILPALYQGVLTNIVSLVAYARAVSILGPSRAAPFAALIPAVTAFLSILILGEFPSPADWAGIAAVTAGVYLASRAPLRRHIGLGTVG
jgi:drug/metabolite transporter (DMT)-like permease